MTDLERVEIEYGERLAARAAEWQRRHPEEAAVIRAAVAVQFAQPGRPEPTPGSLPSRMLDAAVVEAIRVKKKWPTTRQFMAEVGVPLTPPPAVPLKIVLPVVDRLDHKAASAGERRDAKTLAAGTERE